jgi:hypothetical protein
MLQSWCVHALQICEHPRLFGAMRDLWGATYACQAEGFKHPYAAEMNPDCGYAYIDRIGFR